ncbi:MAG: hypothetical protein QM705_15170 [Ancrocorticia sp.]
MEVGVGAVELVLDCCSPDFDLVDSFAEFGGGECVVDGKVEETFFFDVEGGKLFLQAGMGFVSAC